VIERRAKDLREFGVGSIGDRRQRIGRNQQRPGKALRLALLIAGQARLAGVDGVAVEPQRDDEASLGVVGLEDLDVRGVIDAFGGQAATRSRWTMRRMYRCRELGARDSPPRPT
jgi:hypothetical protein